MIIMIGSQKGGCGKSTTAMNISVGLALKGHDVALVDADTQPTCTNWAGDRELLDVPQITLVQAYGDIMEVLFRLEKLHEIVVVDAAGRDSMELRSGILAADILVIPFRPSQADLDTLYTMQELITGAREKDNRELRVVGLMAMAPTNPIISESREAEEYLKSFPEIELLQTKIRDRKVYRDALSQGLGVVEMSNHKARNEINSLIEEVFDNE